MKRTKKKPKVDLAGIVHKYLRAHEAGKRGYAKADALLDEIASMVKPGRPIPLNDNGKKAVLVDEFKGKSTVFKPCGVRRFSLKILEA